jgi:organic hydroperoxide reductase OsmC/OhrA
MKTIYTAIATVHGGREGHVRSDDGVLDLDLRMPKVCPYSNATRGNIDVILVAQ